MDDHLTNHLTRTSLRRATPDDAPVLAQLCQAHAQYERIAYQAQGHAARLQLALAQGWLQVFLAVVDAVAVGYASATLDFATLDGRSFLHMDCLYLQPAARNLGLGVQLMQQLAQLGQQLGCTNLQWQTPDWNLDAIRFYRRSGARQLAKARFVLDLATPGIDV